MRIRKLLVAGFAFVSISVLAQSPAPKSVSLQSQPAVAQNLPTPTNMNELVDRVIMREHALMDFLKNRKPLVETYLQNLRPDDQLGAVPKEDHYFLGRLDLGDVERQDYLSKDSNVQSHLLGGISRLYRVQYQPLGLSWMVFVDHNQFDRQHYDFHYNSTEFLGDVKCYVFDIQPKANAGKGRFIGRIWVEDQGYNIVRLNGTYGSTTNYYFHMDSWRLNLVPGFWIPSYIYSEEGDFSYGAKNKSAAAFKAQTRIWGYDLKQDNPEAELTQIKIDSTVKDNSAAAADASPLEAQRQWQQQAEDNVVNRLESAGLIAPDSEVDKVLMTVVNNLEVTNNINLPRPVRTRVMITSPLETFSVGNTIIISRGLVDVLPDEASLATVLSHELAHIVLGHNIGSQYAFNDRMFFSDSDTYKNMGFRHSPEEETAADKKAEELLKNSPYAQKLSSAGLFLRELDMRGPQITALLTAHLGNGFADEKGHVIRFNDLMQAAPALQENKIDQIAALPLGGRVKLDPWTDKVDLIKAAPVAYTSARDKMPFEVTPFFPRLSRISNPDPIAANAPTTANAAAPTN
ncbi:MAG TPA: M48 family metalloprotease [Terriglobales bacterium]